MYVLMVAKGVAERVETEVTPFYSCANLIGVSGDPLTRPDSRASLRRAKGLIRDIQLYECRC